MPTDLVIWETKDKNWGLSIAAAAGMALCFSLLFDDFILGIPIGCAIGVSFLSFGEKRFAKFEHGMFTYDIGQGDGPVSVPVDHVASIEQKADGDLYFTLADGTDAVIRSGGDKEGVAAFVAKTQGVLGDPGQRFLD